MTVPPEDALIDLAADYGQTTYELLVSDDLGQHIPLIKTLLAAGKAVQSVRDSILMRKLAACLSPLATQTRADERRKMLEQLESDPDYGRKVGEHLIEILDKVDSKRKPEMVGKVFTALALGQIDRRALQRLIEAIDRLPTAEINTVRRFLKSENNPPERARLDEESLQALLNAGLATPLSAFSGLAYKPNQTCSLFVELALDLT